ncbi:MAG: hypothetical protein SO205_07855 [Bulleidia sp.]|nr:hypothetical protein [Bulleidia sp.]
MAKVNVNSALKRDDIRKVLESQECPKYTFVKMLGPMEMQFEVEDDGTHGDLANYTKSLIKKQPWGAALFMRVLNDGQAFTGQNM